MIKEIIKSFSLDFGKLGDQTRELSEMINFPYVYLPDFLREDMPGVARQYVQPLLQDLSRAGKQPVLMREQIAAEKEKFSPDKLPIRDYIFQCKRVYEARLNLYYQISLLMGSYWNTELGNVDLVTEGLVLLRKQPEIEPSMFALAALARKYIEKYTEMIPKGGLSEEELDLLTVMAIPSTFVSFELDMREYLASGKDEKQKLKPGLLKRYFNNEELYFARKITEMEEGLKPVLGDPEKRQQTLDKINDVRDMFKSRWVRKVNFLAERKISYAVELDEVMMMDNCFDKYLSYKAIFLHDLFLKMAMLDVVSRRKVLDLTVENLGGRMREVLFMDNGEFERKMEGYLSQNA